MIKGISKNFGKPQGLIGSILLGGMNKGHEKLTRWALSQVSIHPESVVLDIGCGGGNAIRLMSQISNSVYGVDYSGVSVKKSSRRNADAISHGKVHIVQGSVSSLPFPDDMFDLATAFETIYFWPDLEHDFGEVRRVLKPGGSFMAVYQIGADESKSRRMENRIEGMRVHTPQEVEELFERAGFSRITAHNEISYNGWKDICIVGAK